MMATSALLSCAAALLEQARLLNVLSNLVTVAALTGMVWYPVAIARPHRALVIALIVIVAAGVAEMYLAIRVSLDAALFASLAGRTEAPDFAPMDEALTALGLLPPAKRGRPAHLRIAGAIRLLRLQALALLTQLLTSAGAGVVLAWR